MLSELEMMNNAFKDLFFHEDLLAKKYAELQKEVTDPQMQKMFQGLEMAARTRYKVLSQKMSGFGIV
ncbi:hypothetical protein JOC78_000753 [Bacillus ectoiniformans]|uniref:hypothetical protein n=1 Tax=Bacillus ectoiniformans TaxID=1494429 RepID=UPI00195C9690|nr:hypothetical protein [Bacillus ectoiniformans]MBM7647813.1 hypothetical protein [Bacillus ectoiniformans]